MKIKRINFIECISFLHILNSFIWILLILNTLYTIIFSWWTTKRDRDYIIYSIDYDNFNKCKKQLLFLFIGIIINTFWLNTILTESYLAYLEVLWFPNYPEGDWRKQNEINKKYNYFLNVKNGKFTK